MGCLEKGCLGVSVGEVFEWGVWGVVFWRSVWRWVGEGVFRGCLEGRCLWLDECKRFSFMLIHAFLSFLFSPLCVLICYLFGKSFNDLALLVCLLCIKLQRAVVFPSQC